MIRSRLRPPRLGRQGRTSGARRWSLGVGLAGAAGVAMYFALGPGRAALRASRASRRRSA